jgi:hypothetical protein
MATTAPTGGTDDDVVTPSGTTDITPTAETDGKNTTCAVLAQLAADSEFFECVADSTEPCDTVSCTNELVGRVYSALIVLMPCVSPAAVRLEVREGETVLVDKTVDRSETVEVPELFGLVLDITLDQFEDAIGLEVLGALGREVFSVVKYTVIPLERAKTCNKIVVTKKPTEGTPSQEDTEEPSGRSAGASHSLSLSLLLLPFISLLTLTAK